MSRKIIILVVLICVILLGVGLGALKEYRYQESLGGIPTKEFTFQVIDGQRVIENKKIGFSLKIPADWTDNIQYRQDNDWSGFGLSTPDFLIEESNPNIPAKGCLFGVDVVNYDRRDSDNTAQWIQDSIYIHSGLSEEERNRPPYDRYKVISIDGRFAYEGISYKPPDEEKGLKTRLYKRIELPQVELARVYIFEELSSGDDIERCQKEFDQILATVKIK